MNTELYRLIGKAREACAGCDVAEVVELHELLNEAADYSIRESRTDIYLKLIEVRSFILGIKEYKDRLKPDQLLCDIMNGMLEEN